MYHALGAPLLPRGKVDSLFSDDFIVHHPGKERETVLLNIVVSSSSTSSRLSSQP
jgi:hypothetical protein